MVIITTFTLVIVKQPTTNWAWLWWLRSHLPFWFPRSISLQPWLDELAGWALRETDGPWGPRTVETWIYGCGVSHILVQASKIGFFTGFNGISSIRIARVPPNSHDLSSFPCELAITWEGTHHENRHRKKTVMTIWTGWGSQKSGYLRKWSQKY